MTDDRDLKRTQDDGRRADETVPVRRTSTRRGALGGAAAVAVGAVAAGAALTGCGDGGKSSTSSESSAAGSSTAGASAATTAAESTGGSGSGALSLQINGASHQISYSPDTMLLYVLRDEIGLKGPKFGCGLAQCGACAVLADGKQIRSCVTPASAVSGKKITTLEGLPAVYKEGGETLHPLQQAWIDEQVPQCGYCQSGMIIQAADLLASNPNPTDAQIRTAMDGHLCRCGTYNGIVRAIERAAKVMA